MKKLIAVIAVLSLLLCVFAGCGKSTVEYYDGEETAEAASATAAEEPAPEAAADPASAEMPVSIGQGGTGYETFPADMVVATINGEEVTWMEYYYWLNNYTNYYLQMATQYGIIISDWEANDISAEETNAEAIIKSTQTELILNHALRSLAAERGLALTDEDQATISDLFDRNADSAVGDGDGTATEEEAAAFLDYLANEMHIDRDVFEQYYGAEDLLMQKIFVEEFGENGSKVTDEEALAFSEENGYMAAKHILLATIDTATREALSDEEIEEKHQRADDLYAELSALVGDAEALEARFDELAAEYTDDNGYASYPDGYIFSEGEMVQPFEDAVKALEVGGLSEVVESDLGYHIILRIPIDPEGIIGMDAAGTAYSLRYAVANRQFNAELRALVDAADVTWSEGFETPDMPAIFG